MATQIQGGGGSSHSLSAVFHRRQGPARGVHQGVAAAAQTAGGPRESSLQQGDESKGMDRTAACMQETAHHAGLLGNHQ